MLKLRNERTNYPFPHWKTSSLRAELPVRPSNDVSKSALALHELPQLLALVNPSPFMIPEDIYDPLLGNEYLNNISLINNAA